MRQAISVCALFFAVTGSLLAQSPNATVNGQVVDPSGAAIAGATVEVINDSTNVRYTTKTNGEGIYVVPGLPPATYRIEVSHVGFKTVLKPDVIFNVRDAVAINFKLPIGSLSETVTVEAGASMINTTSAAVSTVVDQAYVKNMPLNGRSFQELILLTPGIVTQTPQPNGSPALGMGGEFSVNGQRTESNYYTVDGVSANLGAVAGSNMVNGAAPSGSVAASTALGTTQALVSVDDLQEFRVQSSTYSAEYGRNPGGQFAFETKSGTNQWHGTAYDYLRNDYFDANDWFSDYFRAVDPSLTKPATRQNDFGGTFGGPVRIPGLYNGKGKTFFFVSSEGLRLVQPQPASANPVPDLCMRGVVAQCPSGRQPAPTALQPVINAFPVPSPRGLENAKNGTNQFIGSWSNPSALDSTSVRFDQVVNDKLRLFFRFSDTASNSASRGGGLSPTRDNILAYTLRTYTGGAASLFSNRLSNEFRLNYSSNRTTYTSVIDAFGGGTPVDLRQLEGLGSGSVAGVTFNLGAFMNLAQDLESGAERQWNFVDTVSLSLGRHQLRFGADHRRLAPSAVPPSPSVIYLFLNEARVEANSPLSVVRANAPAYPLYTNFSAFAQDEWRVSQRLSLSFGLRWEVNPAPGVTQGFMPYTIQGSSPDTWTLAPQGTPLWQTTWFNFAPRLGVAYVLHNGPGRETVVRGGGGVFFDTGQQLGSQGFNGPGFGARKAQFTSFPSHPVVPAIANPPMAGSYTPVAFAPHLQLPYTLQWNASIEQALGKSQALTLSYVGSHASRLLTENDLLVPNNPNFGEVFLAGNGLTSDYESLQVQFRRRLGQGLTTLASYGWSHCLDYGSQNYTFGYQRGNCDFDVRHNLSAAFSYDLPNVGHSGFAKLILHDWGIDDRFTARTAFPVTLDGTTLVDLITGQQYHAGLNFVPGQPVYLYGSNCASVLQGLGDLAPRQGCPGGRAINPNVFANVDSGFGNAPRNFARGFGAWQMNLAVRRDFPIHERLKLQFRAEAFNTFNHPNFGVIDSAFGDTTFGQATGTLASTLGVLNPLYQMGGPRSMQFALKLLF
jgi:Carboxypeptidase regulatory-like domain